MGDDFIFYICVFGFAYLNCFYSINHKRKWNDKLYNLYFLFLFVILAFRYGQGSDYFSYQNIFAVCSVWKNVVNRATHGEIGFHILCYLFKGNYELFVSALAAFDMCMLYRGIKKFSNNKWMSLCIFFPVGYMSYFFSSYRQSIVIAVFLGYLLECICEKKWKAYYITVLILTFIHTSAWILTLVPVILMMPQTFIFIFSIVLAVLGIFSMSAAGRAFWGGVPFFGEFLEYYTDSMGVGARIFPVLERITLALLIYLLYHFVKKRNITKYTNEFVSIYIFGIGIYFLLSGISVLTASRIMIYFKLLEIYIIANLIRYSSRWRQILNIVLVFITTFMLIKNINSYLSQGSYYSDVTVIDYPYISIFNKEDIWEYRERPR